MSVEILLAHSTNGHLDARPDYAPWSSDRRMEIGIAKALLHMLTFVHPQVYFSDELQYEEGTFSRPLRARVNQQQTTLIEVPRRQASTMLWMARLDSLALRCMFSVFVVWPALTLVAWYDVNVDIVIQANTETAGSLIQLLRSIEGADYFGLRHPHITVELPESIEHSMFDDQTQRFLNQFSWPPSDSSGRPSSSRLTLRRRIPVHQYSPLEASARHKESLYPAQPVDSNSRPPALASLRTLTSQQSLPPPSDPRVPPLRLPLQSARVRLCHGHLPTSSNDSPRWSHAF